MSNPFVRRSRGVAEAALQAPQISRFQQILLDQGFVDTLLFVQPTGSVSDGMRAALRRYQRSRNLPETGILDPSTQDRLDREVGAPPPVALAPSPPAPSLDAAAPPGAALAAEAPRAPVEVSPRSPAGMSTGTKVLIIAGVGVVVALVAIAASRAASSHDEGRRRR